MNNTELNLAMLNGLIYTILGLVAYDNGFKVITVCALIVAFVFVMFSVILDK